MKPAFPVNPSVTPPGRPARDWGSKVALRFRELIGWLGNELQSWFAVVVAKGTISQTNVFVAIRDEANRCSELAGPDREGSRHRPSEDSLHE